MKLAAIKYLKVKRIFNLLALSLEIGDKIFVIDKYNGLIMN